MNDEKFELEFEKFKRDIKVLIGLDLNQYKSAQMKRRIKSFVVKHKQETLTDFIQLLKRDADVLMAFKDFITINVTEFFRNPEKFDMLKTKVLPEIIEKFRKRQQLTLRLWSAGCSTGAEAYSLAIMMSENFPGVPYSIIATDIDKTIVDAARTGEFKDIEIKNVNNYLLKKCFDELPDVGKWKIKAKYKEKIKFSINNLLEDSFTGGIDLICCRNVVIYFTEEAKDKLYEKFYNALTPDGVLFIGGTESILNARQIGFSSKYNLFYYK